MPEELAQQMPVMKDVLRAMNIPVYACQGWEADDVIGTVAKRCAAADWDCVIVTGDRDSLQLVDGHVTVKLVATKGGQTSSTNYTPEVFRAEYGFEPIRLIDLKALMGDSSDNIPGVPGVGEKTAMALVREYRSIDAVYADLPGLHAKPGVIKKLVEGEQSARHSYWLATIVTDAPLAFDPADNLRRPFRPELYDIFLRLEFKKLIDRYHLTPPHETAERDTDFRVTVETVTARDRAAELLGLWRQAGGVTVYALPDLCAIAVECETEEKTSLTANLIESRYEGDWDSLLQALFAADIAKTSHNVKDLIRALLERGIDPDGFVFDTALGGYLLDATAAGFEIERLFMSYYNEEVAGQSHPDASDFTPLGDPVMAEAALDSRCSAVAALREYQEPRLREMNMWPLFTEVELPLCRVLADMERAGMRCDGKALSSFGDWLRGEIGSLEREIYRMAGGEFNINSPKQLGKVLFEDLHLPHGKKTKTGWSTNADVLENLRYDAPIVDRILTYRQYTKLKSTYADGLLKAIDPDGRVRTSFQMTVTATGRLSSTEPNLQNIPTRTELGSQIRRLFTAEEGCVLVDADYSQIELRLLAHMAGDTVMQQAFRDGADFHTVTAARVFHVPPEQVTGDMRRSAKAVNFGIVYGISAFSLSRDIGVTVAEARNYMERYFDTYQGVRQYMTDVVEQAKERGYVETLWHRRRALPELKSSNFNMRAFGERVALNMPIQGTAADIIKLAMVRVSGRLKAEGLRARLIMQVHDELIVECPEAERETVEKLLTEEMERVALLAVPLKADAHAGRNWLEAKG